MDASYQSDDSSHSVTKPIVKPVGQKADRKVEYKRSPTGQYDGSRSNNQHRNPNPTHNGVHNMATETATVSAMNKGTMINMAKVVASYTVPGYAIYLIARQIVFLPVAMEPIASFLGLNVR